MFERHIERGHRCDECDDWTYWVRAILVHQIQTKEEIMADLSALNDAVDALVAEENSVKAALDDLAAKVAAGNGVTQADIDAVSARLEGVTSDLKAAVDADDPAPTAPAPIDSGATVPGVPAETEQGGGIVTDTPTVGDMPDASPSA